MPGRSSTQIGQPMTVVALHGIRMTPEEGVTHSVLAGVLSSETVGNLRVSADDRLPSLPGVGKRMDHARERAPVPSWNRLSARDPSVPARGNTHQYEERS